MGGIDGDLTAPLLEAADHVFLHAVVHQGHPQLLLAQGGIELGGLPGHFLHGALHPVGMDLLQALLYMKMLRTGDHAVHGPLTAEYSGQSPGIDTLDPGDVILFQIGVQLTLAAEIAASPGQVPHDKGLRPGLGGLVVLVVHAVIANEGIAHYDPLSRVGGIGEDLLVAGHGGVEHHLTHPVCGRAHADALEHGAVLQNQGRLHLLHHAFLSMVFVRLYSKYLPPATPFFPSFSKS